MLKLNFLCRFPPSHFIPIPSFPFHVFPHLYLFTVFLLSFNPILLLDRFCSALFFNYSYFHFSSSSSLPCFLFLIFSSSHFLPHLLFLVFSFSYSPSLFLLLIFSSLPPTPYHPTLFSSFHPFRLFPSLPPFFSYFFIFSPYFPPNLTLFLILFFSS